MSSAIDQLLGTTLILVAHPDDESIGCGMLLQGIASADILLCTDGGPAMGRPWYSRIVHSRTRYAGKRLKEFRAASRTAGVRYTCEMQGIQDQLLYQYLERAAGFLAEQIVRCRPDAILSHAFEAGHPDHDCCAFLAQWAGRKFSLPVWEMPLYYRPTPSSPLVYQQFLCSYGNEVELFPEPHKLLIKTRMLSQHRSQAAVISGFDKAREVFRPQAPYDFSVNPNPALSTFAVCAHISIDRVLDSFSSFAP
ncbi:MAG: PIG-L family deacetylase [Acidobacteria bacterium]|nr:PIG-L family deacetylase [Acidobacteriota bacterium]